jgi:hypothetical protein
MKDAASTLTSNAYIQTEDVVVASAKGPEAAIVGVGSKIVLWNSLVHPRQEMVEMQLGPHDPGVSIVVTDSAGKVVPSATIPAIPTFNKTGVRARSIYIQRFTPPPRARFFLGGEAVCTCDPISHFLGVFSLTLITINDVSRH